MPAVRLSSRRGSAVSRRRSSLAAAFAKPGTYGYSSPPTSPSAPPVTFAPNVTPTSYSAPSRTPSPFGSPSLTTDLPLPIFPPSETPAPAPTRKRAPPGKRRSQGYIPRPPNAFMLFRADFVRQKHVPGSIETNHGSLSKIIGNCWRSLPLAEKHIWEVKAKHAKAEHKQKYPDYKFRPVHNKNRNATLAADATRAQSVAAPVKGQLSPEEDERRCEEVAALLLQGKKGQELAYAVRDLDSRRMPRLSPDPAAMPFAHASKFPHPLNLDPMYYPQVPSPPPSSTITSSHASTASANGTPYTFPAPLQHDGEPATWRQHRRSSSVPLPNDYAYTFPPFMYGEHAHAGSGMGLTLPPINFLASAAPAPSSSEFLPPPPSSSDDSLAGLPMSISGPGRMSFSWLHGTAGGAGSSLGLGGTGAGSSFSYPRPSFSFGFGAGSGARPSFSYAGAFGGTWAGPIGRRASSAQAYFSPTTFKFADAVQEAAQPQAEELPDADTSLFEAGFLSSFGAPAPAPTAASPVTESVSPFDPSAVLHAPQPVHVVSPVGVEFGEQLQHQSQQQHHHHHQQQSPAQVYEQAAYVEESYAPQYIPEATAAQQPHEEYPPFEFPAEGESLAFESRLHAPLGTSPAASSSSSSAYDVEMSTYDSYASEFV